LNTFLSDRYFSNPTSFLSNLNLIPLLILRLSPLSTGSLYFTQGAATINPIPSVAIVLVPAVGDVKPVWRTTIRLSTGKLSGWMMENPLLFSGEAMISKAKKTNLQR
jgi:hypothetical protein